MCCSLSHTNQSYLQTLTHLVVFPQVVVWYLYQIASAVAHIHKAGILHRLDFQIFPNKHFLKLQFFFLETDDNTVFLLAPQRYQNSQHLPDKD